MPHLEGEELEREYARYFDTSKAPSQDAEKKYGDGGSSSSDQGHSSSEKPTEKPAITNQDEHV